MRWIRLDVDFDDTPWLFCLSAESQLAWLKLLCYTKRSGIGGRVKALSSIVAAKKWGVGEESVTKLLQAAVLDGALQLDGSDWVITKWADFQEPDNTNAERQRRFRERKQGKETVTQSNAVTPVTLPVTCRVTETETITETEKEERKENRAKEKKEEKSVSETGYPVSGPIIEPSELVQPSQAGEVYGSEFLEFWDAYPHPPGLQRKSDCAKLYYTLLRAGKVAPETLNAGVKRYATWCKQQSKDPRYIPTPTNWLKHEGWKQDYSQSAIETPQQKAERLKAELKSRRNA